MLETPNKFSIDISPLSNGAKLLFKQLPDAPRVAISFYLPGGNQNDPIPGMSDIVDRLLMKGTKTRSQEDIAIAIDGMTLDMDIDTKRDYSMIYATLLEEDLEASLALIADLFYNALPEETLEAEFNREKEKLAGEIMMELDSPKSRASDALVGSIFGETPYGVVSSLVLESLPKMTSAQAAKEHYEKAYQTDGMIISATGNLDETDLKKLLEQYFPKRNTPGYLPNQAVAKTLSALTITKSDYVTHAKDDSAQAHIYKGWIVPNAHHPDYFPLTVMNTILGGGGLSSRLFIELRDKQGLAYNVRSSLEAYQHNGLFLIYIGTEPSNKDKCLNGFIEECEKLVTTQVSAEELADAKRNILGRRSIYLETGPQLCNYIGANYVMGKTLEDIERLPERIEAVTAEDIQRVARQYLSKTAPSVVSIAGPSSIL